MSDCCSSTKQTSVTTKRFYCPSCNTENKQVSASTIFQHLQDPWDWQNDTQQHYYCENPQCDVVYFSQDDSIIRQAQLRTKVGIKTQSSDDLICYCYGVTYGQIKAEPTLKQFVIDKTKRQLCACEVRNPSGRCCLKDFPN